MRPILFLFTILLFAGRTIAAAGNPAKDSATVINANDTIVLDLSNAVCSGGYIDIPISILSNDTVYAVDFSLKYTMTKLTFDSVISYKSYFYPTAYLDPNDSILRFTSFSLQQVENNTPLAALRFQLFSSPISTADFYSIHGYLNGDPCSVKVTGAATITAGGPTTFSIGDSVCLSAN